MKLNKLYYILLCLTLLICDTQAKENSDSAYKKLGEILWEVNNEDITETHYYKLLPLVEKYVVVISSASTEHKFRNNEFPNFNWLVKKFGLSLSKIRNKLLYNVKGNNDYWSLLALSMLNDLEAKKILQGKIFNSNLKQERFAYVKLLAYFNSDIQETKSILQMIKKNEWYPPLITLITYISDSLDGFNSKWKRFLIWEELQKIESELSCDVYDFKTDSLNNPTSNDSNTNLLSQLTDIDKGYLKSKNINPELIDGIWKNTKLFKYIIKLSNKKNSLILINGLDEIDIFDSLQPYENKLYDLFTIGNRHFFINSFGTFHIDKFIYELVWDYDNSKYKLSRRFELGNFYKELLINDNHIFVVGKNWKYKINKETGIIESGTLCGKNVVINQAL